MSKSVVLFSFGLLGLVSCSVMSASPNPGLSASRARSGTGQLIYALENNGTVNVYSYPNAKLKGQLDGFGGLYGACADSNDHVYIVDYGKAAILEYAAGGNLPIEVFSDKGYSPTDCSVDPTTGNVAVANIYAHNYSSGTVAIYNRSDSRPRLLTNPDMFEPFHCGYDPQGNLYVDGYSKDLAFKFAVLPAGSSQFTSINLSKTFTPGNVQWDGKYVAVGDAGSNVIYQFSITGSVGTEVGSTTLGGVTYGLNEFWIAGGKVIGAAAVDSEVGIWKYPAGGTALKTIKQNGSYVPIGVAVTATSPI